MVIDDFNVDEIKFSETEMVNCSFPVVTKYFFGAYKSDEKELLLVHNKKVDQLLGRLP